MEESISFLHAADLHLDSPFKGLTHLPENIFDEVRQSTFHSFQQLIDLAISKHVDFIVLVGDLFDHERQSLKAQIRLRTAFRELEKHQIQVYLSYGNHDFIKGNVHAVEYPTNVHVFPGETVTSFTFHKSDRTSVQISGFSYENRAVTAEKIKGFPERNQQASYHIGMLHGSVYGNQQHDAYAPFRIPQLIDKQYDYWALGHIHKQQELHQHPPIIYPGNIQSRHRNEQGEKGCYLVKLQKRNVEKHFIPLQGIEFLQLDMDLTDNHTLEKIETEVWDSLHNEENGKTLVSITWHSSSEYWAAEHANGWLDDLIDGLNEQFFADDSWKFIYKHELKLKQNETPGYSTQFIREIEKAFSQMDIQEELKELTSNAKGRKFFERPEENLKEAAKELLYIELVHTERDE